MKNFCQKIVIIFMVVIIATQGILPVCAEDGIFEALKNCENGEEIALLLDSLSDAEAEEMGISTDKYKSISYRDYCGELILKAGFETNEDFVTSFNGAVDECLSEVIVEPDSLIGYVKRTAATPKVTFGVGAANVLRWQGSEAYYHFEIENISAIKDCSLNISINTADRWIKVDGYSVDSIPGYTTENIEYLSDSDEYEAWEEYVNNMTSISEKEFKGEYEPLWQEAVQAIKNSNGNVGNLTLRCFSDVNAYVSSPEYDGATLKVLYDNTVIWENECQINPADGEIVIADINEIIFDWEFEIDTNTWNEANISLYKITDGEVISPVSITSTVHSSVKTGIIFECEDLSKYKIVIKNIEKPDGTELINRISRFETDFETNDIVYEKFQQLKNCENGADIISILNTLTEAEIEELGIDLEKYKIIKYKNYFGELILEYGFSNKDEFKTAYNNAIDDCLEEKIVNSQSLISYVNRVNGSNEETSDPNVTYSASAANTFRWAGNEGYYYFNIQNPAAIRDISLNIYINGADNEKWIKTDGYSFGEIPNYSQTQLKYTTSDEEYLQWEEFENSMVTTTAIEFRGEYNSLWDDFVGELKKCTAKSQSLLLRCYSDVNAYVSAPEYDGAKLKILYDNTVVWNQECKVTPSDGETVTSEINEIIFEWEYEINDATWVSQNLQVFDVTNNTEIDFSPVVYSNVKTGIRFECQDLCEYKISTKNIKKADTTNVANITTTFSTNFDISNALITNINVYGNTQFLVNDDQEYLVKGLNEVKEGILDINSISFESENENVIAFNEKKAEAKKRGLTVIKVTRTNSDNSEVSKRFVGAVMTKFDKFSFDDSQTEAPAYLNKSLKVSSKELVCKVDEVFGIWFYDDGVSDKQYCGIEFEKNGSNLFVGINNNTYVCGEGTYSQGRTKGWHQIILDNNSKSVYLDGEKITTQMSYDDAYVVCTNGDFWVDEAFTGNISGEICTVENVVIRGISNIADKTSYSGVSLSGDYSYSDMDNDVETGTLCKWMYSSSENGVYSDTGVQGKTFVPGTEYENMYIKFEVTPKNIYDAGQPVLSNAVKIIVNQGNSNGSGGSSTGGGFVPKKTNLEIVAPFVNNDTISKNNIFSDVSQEHWASTYVTELAKEGIVNGDENGEFNPENNITRAEFIKMIVLAFNLDMYKYSGKYTDVDGNEWYSHYIETASIYNIVQGSENKFYPNKFITREEMAKIIVSAYELKNKTSSGQYDENVIKDMKNVSDWALEFVKKAIEYKIVQGNELGEFLPNNNLTRAEAATVIYRASR